MHVLFIATVAKELSGWQVAEVELIIDGDVCVKITAVFHSAVDLKVF